MLRGERVTLRAVERRDLERLWLFWNDLEVELAGGGDPPQPLSLQRLRERFDREAREGTQDKIDFIIEAGEECIGECGLFHIDLAARHCELGITIGERECWGCGYGGEAVKWVLDYAFRVRNLGGVGLGVQGGSGRAMRAYRA